MFIVVSRQDTTSCQMTTRYQSTAKLTNVHLSKSEEALGDYDPFSHRNIDKPTSDYGALAHLLKGSLGSGILAMPLAFKHGGLTFSIVMTIIIGIICTHCVQMLVDCSHTLCKRARIPLLDFSETAHVAFQHGPGSFQRMAGVARNLVNTSLVLAYLSGNAVYVAIISQSIKKIIVDDNQIESWRQVDLRIYILMIWGPIFLLCCIKELKYLVPFSIIANLCIVVVFGITLSYMFEVINNPADRNQMGKVADLPSFFSTVIFAMEGIGVVMPLENTMRNPQRFTGCPGVLNIGMAVVVVLYAIIGFFGYLRFGDDVLGSITLNLDRNLGPAKACQYLIAISIFFTYALQFYVPTQIIWESIKGYFTKSRHAIYNYILRFLLVSSTVCLAIAVPELEAIIGLVGAICFSVLGLTLPSIIDIATRYSTGYGLCKWILWKDVIIIILSLLGLVFGTYNSIIGIIKQYSHPVSDQIQH